jgi:beta-1,4-glucosyltransferase
MPLQRDIAGFMIRDTRTPVFIRFLNARLRRRQPTVVFFANANFIVRCSHLRADIAAAPDVFVLGDGVALDAVARLLFGSAFRENMNGTDFTPAALARLTEERRVFLLGADAMTVGTAAAWFDQLPKVEVVGAIDGYSIWQDEQAALARIRAAAPDILLVGMGNPLQEEWILRQRDRLGIPLIMGIGALFDFVAGNKPRAPESLRRLRLEWAHRLALEPRRLLGRYTLVILRFFAVAILYRARRAVR